MSFVREKMSKEVRTVRGCSTHWDSMPDLMGAHQSQLDWDWRNMWSNGTLWMWLTMEADWEAIDKGTGTCFYCTYWLFGTLVYLNAHLPRPGWSGEGLGQPRNSSSSVEMLLGLLGGTIQKDTEQNSRPKWLHLAHHFPSLFDFAGHHGSLPTPTAHHPVVHFKNCSGKHLQVSKTTSTPSISYLLSPFQPLD